MGRKKTGRVVGHPVGQAHRPGCPDSNLTHLGSVCIGCIEPYDGDAVGDADYHLSGSPDEDSQSH